MDQTCLPLYTFGAPNAEQVEILHFLYEQEERSEATSKRDLIDYSEEVGLPFIADKEIQEKGKCRLLDKNVLDPLLADGYVGIVKSGRQKYVQITHDGANTLRAFRYLLGEAQANDDDPDVNSHEPSEVVES